MTQFNLLPDVKLEYLRTQRLQRLVVSVSILAGAVALVVFLIMVLTVDVWQKKTISDLKGDIKTSSKQLQDTPGLNKILTIQNQLGALGSLHDAKPVTPRLFGFLSQVTPTDVTISNMSTDFTAYTMSISGDAPSLDAVNTFVDSLKFTKYTVTGSSDKTPAFSDVVLATFSRDNSGAKYNITLTYDPKIFSTASEVQLVVPDIISTRSVTEQPTVLFDQKKGEEQ